jgi:hypothetical protein
MKKQDPRFYPLGVAEFNYPSVKRPGFFLVQSQLNNPHWREQSGVTFGCKDRNFFRVYLLTGLSSDWTLDVTHPSVDADEGWQYAQSFDVPDDKWTAEMPAQLERIMSSNGIVSAGFGGSSVRNHSLSSNTPGRHQPNWVRRRRWVRIMRRRLDIPPLAFLEPDGAMYHVDSDGSLIPYVEESQPSHSDGDEGREMGTMTSTFLSSAQDYVARARYLAGSQLQDIDTNPQASAVDVRRAIAKVERATMELRQGILSMLLWTCKTISYPYLSSLGDDDPERKLQAEVLLKAYNRDLERRRLAAGAQGLLISDYGVPHCSIKILSVLMIFR